MTKQRKARRTRTLTAIDLFSGCGGLSVGLRRAGFRVSAAVEIDRKAQATYRLNHPDVKLYSRDIRRLSGKAILTDLKLKPGDLDLLAGCPPCQGFSRLRTRNQKTSVADPRNNLIREFLRFVRVLKPKTVMLENVPALKKDVRFKNLCKQLRQLRYEYVAEVLNAADYSVPQRRQRLILLASRVHTPIIKGAAKQQVTVRDALKEIKPPSKTKDALHRMAENRSAHVKAIIRLIPLNGGSRSDLPQEYQLECHQRSDGFHDVYGRMAWDAPAPTITSGCTNPSKGRFLHPVRHRSITLREAAVLQGFPKSYKFRIADGKGSIALMIGNALPPPFIAHHARGLRDGIMERNEKRLKRR